ncbi:hypothetical protein GCM10010343_37540 [Streptomyces avidinii]|nr:hypothetical protein GCM10010343_37540 [Streptomyces avidinii]
MTEDVPTTARVQDVLNRATRVVIVEGAPGEVDSIDLSRLVVTGDEIADLARHLAIVDGGTGDKCRCSGSGRQLHDESADLVLAALAAHPPSPAQLDGASELFCTPEWTTAHGRHLPEPQRSMLIGHIQAVGTDAMRRRLSWGYYGAERTVD